MRKALLSMMVALDGFIEGPNGDIDWVEHYRRFWEQRFDRLDNYLHELQRKDKKHGRKK
jgi:hypothetical protein